MKILFVRHAAAEEFSASGNDLSRELTDEGRKKAQKAFKGLSSLYESLDLIITSKAVRARQTAKLLAEAFKCSTINEVDALNPGCAYPVFKKIMKDHAQKKEIIAVVGHEPDFSRIIAAITSDGSLHIDVKKASCVEIEMNSICRGELKALIPPKVAAAVKKPNED